MVERAWTRCSHCGHRGRDPSQTIRHAWRDPPAVPCRVLDVAGMLFSGAYHDAADLRDAPGVYAVLDVRRDRRGRYKYGCVDVGTSESVRSRVGSHDRKRCWLRHAEGALAFAVLYTDSAAHRMRIEKAARALLAPPCGARPAVRRDGVHMQPRMQNDAQPGQSRAGMEPAPRDRQGPASCGGLGPLRRRTSSPESAYGRARRTAHSLVGRRNTPLLSVSV